jgi:guanylate kinase
MNQNNSGLVYVISAPSGAGKTSLVKKLLNDLPILDVCVSHTTRAPRSGEQNGKEYFFISRSRFLEIKRVKGFVEYAEVFGNYYGTSKLEIDRIISTGRSAILEIDWQGARQIRKMFPDQVVGIFILPPTLDILEKRLRLRGKDSDEVIAARMKEAKDEISHANEYKHTIINDDFDIAVAELLDIIKGQG